MRFWGVTVTPMTADGVVASLASRALKPVLLLNHNLHSVYLYHTSDAFRHLYDQAEMVIVDGWPVLRMLANRNYGAEYRIGSTDWIARLDTHSGHPLRIFLLGTSPEKNEAAVQRLSAALPRMTVEGCDGYFDLETEASGVIERLRDFSPDLVLVGMGMPRQEAFLLQHLSELPPAVYATVGGAIDYLSGTSKLSPRVFGKFGVEWLWRLLLDPRRLAGRYLVEPCKLLTLLLLRRVNLGRRSESGKR